VSSYHALFASTAALVWLAACKNEAIGKDSTRAGTSSQRQAQVEDAGRQAAPVTLALSLDGMRVTVALPAGWNILPEQSDEGAGLVAFAPHRALQGGTELAFSAFLDGTRMVRTPSSLTEAVAETLRHDHCKNPALCNVLGRETLPEGGYLVSVKTPQSIQVQSWRPGPHGRAVRCGAEVATLPSPPDTKPSPGDTVALEQFRPSIEGLCRSVTARP